MGDKRKGRLKMKRESEKERRTEAKKKYGHVRGEQFWAEMRGKEKMSRCK